MRFELIARRADMQNVNDAASLVDGERGINPIDGQSVASNSNTSSLVVEELPGKFPSTATHDLEDAS